MISLEVFNEFKQQYPQWKHLNILDRQHASVRNDWFAFLDDKAKLSDDSQRSKIATLHQLLEKIQLIAKTESECLTGDNVSKGTTLKSSEHIAFDDIHCLATSAIKEVIKQK